MTPEYAVQWLIEERFNQWRLFRDKNGADEKVSEYDSDNESETEAVERLQRILPLQQPGKYELRGYKGKSKQAAQSIFRFDIKTPSASAVSANASQPAFDPEQWMKKAEEAAYAKLEFKNWQKEIEKRIDCLETSLKDVALSVKEFHDDDDENDGDAFSRITDVADKIPKLQGGLQALQGMLKMK